MWTLFQDIRFAARTLRKGLLVTGFAVLSLALAIGGNATVFSLINAMLIRPLPYPDADRIVLVQDRRKDQPSVASTLTTSLATLADLQDRSRSTTGWAGFRPAPVSLRGNERPIPLSGARVTAEFFPLLGAVAARGRTFRLEEVVEGAPRVVVLSHEYWQRTLGESEDPIGSVMNLDGEPHEVIGVLPEGFEFLTPGIDVWLALRQSPAGSPRDRRDLIALGRMRPGVSMTEVRTELASLASEFETEYAATSFGWTMDAYNLRSDIPDSQSRQLFLLLQGSVMFVLLIALANITNLLLARSQDRQREIALRTVLGAGRFRIVRQLMTESLMIVLLGGVAGLALGFVGIRMLANAFAGQLPAIYSPSLDATVVLFTLGLTVSAGLLFGLMPALQTFRRSHAGVLREGGDRGASAGGKKRLVSRVLVVGEIALSLVALGGGSLMVRSFLDLQNADTGFDASGLLTLQFSGLASRYEEDEERVILMDDVLTRVGDLQGVQSATLVNALPQNIFAPADTFRIEGRPVEEGVSVPRATTIFGTPSYLETLGFSLLQGRFLEESDRLDQSPVAVVDRAFVESHFSGQSALGQRVLIRGQSREIVGVVVDISQMLIQGFAGAPTETIYLPLAQVPLRSLFVMVKTERAPRALADPLRVALESADPDLTLNPALTMEEFTDQFFVGIRVFNSILGGFGLLALFLASLGTYGVLAYTVGQRTKEIGVRMAVGAEAKDVIRMISIQGVKMAVIGLVIGAVALVPVTILIRRLLENLTEVQPATLFLVGMVLFAVTLVASILPARRAALVDPVEALRDG